MRLKIIPILIISSLLTIGLFGILGINMTDNNGQHSCPISMFSNDDCLLSSNSFFEVFHHISALQNFTQGMVNINNFSLMLQILLMFIFAIFSTFLRKTPFLQVSPRQNYRKIEELGYSPKKQFLRWIALRYKKDPHASQWAHDYS